jgi:hypothetical protein
MKMENENGRARTLRGGGGDSVVGDLCECSAGDDRLHGDE